MIAVLVVNRAEKNHLVRVLRVLRKLLGNADAADVRLDGAPRPAIFGGRVRLRIVGFEMARAAVEPEEDHRLVVSPRDTARLQSQPIRGRQAEQSKEARLDRGATRCAAAVR